MTPPARPVLVAARRALLGVFANPGLVVAPVVFALACVLSIAVPLGYAVFHFLRSLPRPWTPASFLEAAGSWCAALASPLPILILLGILLLVLLLLTRLAAWVGAGVTGCFLAIDAHAEDGRHLPQFHHPDLWPVFRSSARRFGGRFFALLNIYGLGLSLLLTVLFFPLALGIYGAVSSRPAFLALAFFVFLLLLLPLMGAGAACRALYLVACRLVVSEDVDALEALAHAVEWTRVSLSRVVLAYLAAVGGGIVVGLVFEFPRIVLQLATGRHLWLLAIATVGIVLLQIIAGLVYGLVVNATFVVLWSSPSAGAPPLSEVTPPCIAPPPGRAPPVSFAPSVEPSPPFLV